MTRLKISRAIAVIVAALSALVIVSGAALADTTYVPSTDNNQKVYLSQSCHDAGTGSCHTNYGCDNMSENYRSDVLSKQALGDGRILEDGLLDRQYIVRVGNGLMRENINSSNSWNAKMHIPLHSNAKNAQCDSPVGSDAYGGTMTFHASSNGQQLAAQLKYTMQNVSPGTNDQVSSRTDLDELTDTGAVAAYLESEYHTWNKGVDFLRASVDWAWRIGYAVDRCRGYPRSGQGTTGTKQCSW
ncbi:MAG TPA: hypothetical protein VM307_14600 [Egibacteraceae bacterium]|nr:hypothetical protein [Egibacteraceae bacterium]